jgi:hypothetical protein
MGRCRSSPPRRPGASTISEAPPSPSHPASITGDHPFRGMASTVAHRTIASMSVPLISRRAVQRRVATAGVIAIAGAGILAGCGSSKPAYCADVTNFTNAVGQLKGASPSAIVSDLGNVKSTAQKAFDAVKTSFAPQTSALKTSLAALETSVTQLASSSTRVTALASIPSQVSAVSTAAENFASAAKQKC